MYDLKILNITQKGQGVSRIDGLTVFVDNGIPGDVVQVKIVMVKKSYAVGEIIRILTPSSDRVIPDCPYFPHCGGCQMRHISPEAQLKYKRKQVVDALERIGGIESAETLVQPVLGMNHPLRYRNKAQFKLNHDGVGFYARNTHDIVPIRDCLNQPESCRQVIAITQRIISKGLLTPYDEISGKGILRGVVQRTNRIGEEMITLVLAKDVREKHTAIIDAFIQDLPGLVSLNININATKGNVIFGKETYCIYGQPTMTEQLDALIFDISPRSFFQVNTSQAEVLYRQVKALANLDGSQIVYDLFCGTGTIGLYLAEKAQKVVGIEIIPEAIENAKENAKRNGIDNALFYCGKAEDLLEKAVTENGLPDLLVVDPPRKGIDAHIIDLISAYKVPNVIYVSCNPATLARDIAEFMEKGYKADRVQPVDLFFGSGHVETICLLSKKNS